MYKPQDISSPLLFSGFLRCAEKAIPILKSKSEGVLEMNIPKHNPKYGYRKVYKATSQLLSYTLKQLHFELSNLYKPQSCIGGFTRGRGILYNASPHINKKVVLNIDIKDFFESIPFELIVSTFVRYGFTSEIANDLAEIVTYNKVLVAGFNTSPIVANMCCEDMDAELLALCSAHQISYTRYADDLSFSGESIECVEDIKAIIAQYGFIINDKKTRIYRKGGPQYVTGLTVVDDTYPRIPRRMKRELRSDIYYIVKYGLESHIKYKYHLDMHTLDRYYMGDLCLNEARKIVGWIHFINSVEPMVAKRLNEMLFNKRHEDLGYFINAYGYIENLTDLK